jgi:glutamine amidotransferase-like uncharacterized protein
MQNIATDQIVIYNDKGVSGESLQHTAFTFLRYAPENYHVRYILAKEIIQGGWIYSTKLLVIPGGQDLYYKKSLDGAGNKQIQKFIREGGRFIGICAGAYYAARYIEFAKSSPIEVIGDRELGIFNGTVEGPTLCQYYYNSNKGARAAKINLNIPLPEKEVTVFYNGGGHFVDAANISNTQVIANYENDKAAIIMCNYGKGKAILSGVHFEYDPFLMSSPSAAQSIVNNLQQHNLSRISLIRHIIQECL